MGTAHVEADLYHPGGDAVGVYWELWINGMFSTSGQGPTGYTFQVGCDVGENTEVRLEAAAVGADHAAARFGAVRQQSERSLLVLNHGDYAAFDPGRRDNPCGPLRFPLA